VTDGSGVKDGAEVDCGDGVGEELQKSSKLVSTNDSEFIHSGNS